MKNVARGWRFVAGPGVVRQCIAVALVVSGCQSRPAGEPSDAGSAEATDSMNRSSPNSGVTLADSATAAAVPAAGPPAPPPQSLSPLADSIAQYLVFDPTVQTWFLAAKRGKSLLVDIGRLDVDLSRDSRRKPAYSEAVKALSPVRMGTPVRVYGAWGAEDDTVIGFDSWRGRIVAVVHTSRHLDSLMRKVTTTYAAVQRTDTAEREVPRADSARQGTADSARRGAVDSTHRIAGAAGARPASVVVVSVTASPDTLSRADSAALADSCRHDTLSTDLRARAAVVRDSIELWLRGLPPPPYPRLQSSLRAQSSQVTGCFGGANRVAMTVDLRAGNNEWVRERAVLIDTVGHVTTLRVIDYRLKGHDFLSVLDANGSGVDGIVARGVAEAAGETVILTLEPRDRLSRLAGGFAWENR